MGINQVVAEDVARQNPQSVDAALLMTQASLKTQQMIAKIRGKHILPHATVCLANKTSTGDLEELKIKVDALTTAVSNLLAEKFSKQTTEKQANKRNVRWRSPESSTSSNNSR